MFFMFVYWVTLLLSGGIVGLCGRHLLGGLGYVHGFQMELISMTVLGAAYGVVQLGYMAFLSFIWPTRSKAPFVTESLSHLSALVLIPYQLGMVIPWPHEAMAKFAPLIFLGAFLTVHVFFKLTSMYASIGGTASSRIPALSWGAGSALCALVALVLSGYWGQALEQARPRADQAAAPVEVGGIWRNAQQFPEGAAAVFELDADAEATGLAFYFAKPAPEEAKPDDEAEEPGEVFLTVSVRGATVAEFSSPLPLKKDEWTVYSLAPGQVPPNAQSCQVSWRAQAPPKWAQLVPVKPLASSTRSLLMSGPEIHRQHESQRDSIILLVIDGLGTGQMSGFGYTRKTTRFLNEWGMNTNAFSNAYTGIPETAGACMTMLTGVSPLRHGCISGQAPATTFQSMAEALADRGYVTAAFTEGNAASNGDLVYGSGFERGFAMFDAKCSGTESTLQRASDWIQTQESSDFFAFIRIRELGDVQWDKRYAPGFVSGPTPSPVDVYDSALAYVDRAVGSFLRDITTSYARKVTIAVTSPYGYDFGPKKKEQPVVGLTEDSLRVPLLLYIPGEAPEHRKEIISLEDLCPTLLARAHVPLRHVVDGQDLMQHAIPRYVVSMYGNPLTLSLRYGPWRFACMQTGVGGSTYSQPIELVNIDRFRERGVQTNDMSNNQGLVEKYADFLARYVEKAQVK